MDGVSVRELRQNLSVYLRRVQAGEALQVLSRGRVVAELRPVAAERDAWATFLARPDVHPATRTLGELPPPIEAPPGPTTDEALADVRADRL